MHLPSDNGGIPSATTGVSPFAPPSPVHSAMCCCRLAPCACSLKTAVTCLLFRVIGLNGVIIEPFLWVVNSFLSIADEWHFILKNQVVDIGAVLSGVLLFHCSGSFLCCFILCRGLYSCSARNKKPAQKASFSQSMLSVQVYTEITVRAGHLPRPPANGSICLSSNAAGRAEA